MFFKVINKNKNIVSKVSEIVNKLVRWQKGLAYNNVTCSLKTYLPTAAIWDVQTACVTGNSLSVMI